MAPGSDGLPVHEAVYRRLREMILFGDLAPGEGVTILGLAERLGAGITPVREALRRLTAEGALRPLGNRRVAVPDLTASDLDQIALVRLSLEPHLAEQACNTLKSSDINRIAALDAELNQAIGKGDVAGYLRGNYRFHMALYDRAGLPLLLRIVRTLWLRIGPSHRVICGRLGTTNLPDRHAEALDAMGTGDAGALARAIRDDIRQGIALLRDALVPAEDLIKRG